MLRLLSSEGFRLGQGAIVLAVGACVVPTPGYLGPHRASGTTDSGVGSLGAVVASGTGGGGSTNAGSSESATTGSSTVDCGNGVVDPGEQCDEVAESSQCNADCTRARCGDGVVNARADEECDDGQRPSIERCTSDCRDPRLVLHMRFDGNADDASGNDHPGKLANFEGDEWVEGVVSGALDLDGDDDYIVTEDGVTILPPTTAYTVAFWLNIPAGQNRWAAFYDMTDSTGSFHHYSMQFDNSPQRRLVVWHEDTAAWQTDITDEDLAGAWRHLALVYDQPDLSLYLDGQLAAVGEQAVLPLSAPGHLFIGVDRTGSSQYVLEGQLDDFRIYATALTEEAVNQLVALGE